MEQEESLKAKIEKRNSIHFVNIFLLSRASSTCLGHTKEQVYSTPLKTIADCTNRIQYAFDYLNTKSIRYATHAELL